MGTGRFDRLERERPRNPRSSRSSVETRFGDGDAPGDPATSPDRSGASPARFEAPAAAPGIRVLDTDGGQAFVRCCECRADGFANATRCSSCGADLRTATQRTFNAALWQRLSAEAVAADGEVAALRERRAAADREHAEAVRRAPELLRELERRRALGLPLDDAFDVSAPLRPMARALGRYLGGVLSRILGWLVRPPERRP